ncbi:MAG: dihydroorotate dehydrogenase electron transfer subunit [Candidatus Aceula lacicola]|nr:dihydroorotate dehydrogenase electron transfer subunit [Candidatus Aceula lacicola]
MLKNQHYFKVVSNKKLTARLCHLVLSGKSFKAKIKPGQFIHLRVSSGLKPFFRRPFSVFRSKKSIEILYDVVGGGTKMLSEKTKGTMIDCIGPLGTSFCMPPKKVKKVVMVAGGVGIAPFLGLSDVFKEKKYELVLLYGGRNKDYMFNLKEFKTNGCRVYTSTDDGSVGVKGRVSKLFSKINGNPGEIFIYTCGPKPMMKSVQSFAQKEGICGQASLEEVMACGIGTCLGCSTKTKNGYKTVCKDGPVFKLDEVIF